MVFREAGNEVHGYLLKGECVIICGYSIEWGILFASKDFVLLAGGASFNVVRNPLVHTVPLPVLFCSLQGFIPSGVSRGQMVMGPGHEVLFCLFSQDVFQVCY